MADDRTQTGVVVEIDYPRLIRPYSPEGSNLCAFGAEHFDRSVSSWDKDGEAVWTDVYSFPSISAAKSFAESAHRFLDWYLVDLSHGFPYEIRISAAADHEHPLAVITGPVNRPRKR
ncbi:MAG TPA: hypothetical protein VHC22_24970 [Pirellulales bacterium]|nr:hypothetical protein [Pirellulales bacterium]